MAYLYLASNPSYKLIEWHLLPTIRSGLVKAPKEENAMQKDAARHLDITLASVSLYMS